MAVDSEAIDTVIESPQAGEQIVESLPMPEQLQDAIAAFVAEHHVERTFVKRKRDRANPDVLARGSPRIQGNRK